jgi:hypothetical protein
MKNSVKKLLLVSSSAILSLISVIFFYKAGLGINFPLFTLFLSVVVISLGVLFKRINFSLCLNTFMLFLLSIPLFVTTAEPVRFVLVAVWIYLVTLIVQTLVIPNEKFKFWRYLTTPVEQVTMGFVSPFFAVFKRRNVKLPYMKFLRVVLGVVIALPILAIFFALLVSADLAFREIITDFFSVDFIGDIVVITIWFAAAFWFGFGLFYYNIFKREKYQVKEVNSQEGKSRFFVEGITILSLVELLFLVFNVVQLTYLFGGEDMISGDAFTYSEYARKGFFELVVVSVFALILLAAIYKLVKASNQIKGLVMRLISISGILLLVPMTASAFYRLYMYEDAYGFTRLRTYSHLFIIFLIVVFVWFIIKFSSKLKESVFFYGIQIITLLSLFVVGVLNVDAFIAKQDIDKFGTYIEQDDGRVHDIDNAYITSLSYDAVPILVDYFKDSDEETKQEVAFYLKGMYDELLWRNEVNDIREFNLREFTAREVLKENREEIEKYSNAYESDIISGSSSEKNDYHDYDYKGCTKGMNVKYIDVSSYNQYYSNLSIYDENGKEVEVENVGNCYELESGNYFILVEDYDLFDREVFFVEIEAGDDILYLVSRE